MNKERLRSFLISGRYRAHTEVFFCQSSFSVFLIDPVQTIFDSAQFNFELVQVNFIYKASVTITIASGHFTETQSLTSSHDRASIKGERWGVRGSLLMTRRRRKGDGERQKEEKKRKITHLLHRRCRTKVRGRTRHDSTGVERRGNLQYIQLTIYNIYNLYTTYKWYCLRKLKYWISFRDLYDLSKTPTTTVWSVLHACCFLEAARIHRRASEFCWLQSQVQAVA